MVGGEREVKVENVVSGGCGGREKRCGVYGETLRDGFHGFHGLMKEGSIEGMMGKMLLQFGLWDPRVESTSRPKICRGGFKPRTRGWGSTIFTKPTHVLFFESRHPLAREGSMGETWVMIFLD
jgi:hypothetical protein